MIHIRSLILRRERKIDRLKAELKSQNSLIQNLYELFAKTNQCQLDNKEHHILCLGNSITIHPYKPSIEWYSEHGMAASRPEFDYVHVLENKIKSHNVDNTVSGINIADWEIDFSTDLNTLIGERYNSEDIIVIRIGENVRDTIGFASALELLVEYCKKLTSNVILTGNVWQNAAKEQAIIEVATKKKLTYVPLSWIMALYPKTYPNVGDRLYDMEGKPYLIKKEFIITHPNDIGMGMIAETIYNALRI